MEEILKKLQKEASGSKYRAIKESCTWALGKRAERGAPGPCRPVVGAARAGAETAPRRRGLSRSPCYGRFARRCESYPRELTCDVRILGRAWTFIRLPSGLFISSQTLTGTADLPPPRRPTALPSTLEGGHSSLRQKGSQARASPGS